jgi:hypothetical protein
MMTLVSKFDVNYVNVDVEVKNVKLVKKKELLRLKTV